MSFAEAAAILGLDVGKIYSATHFEEAVTQAEVRAHAFLRYPPHGDLRQREQARQELPRIREAGTVLRPLVKNGKIRIPGRQPGPSASGPAASSRRVAQPSLASGPIAPAALSSPARATAGSLPSVGKMLATAARALRDLLLVTWWVLTCWVKYLVQRKLVRAAVSFVLAGALLWFSLTVLTGGAHALIWQIQRVCEIFNRVTTHTIK
jgi:hypothetical protein